MLLLVSFLIPAGICFGIYQLLMRLGIELTDMLVIGLKPESIILLQSLERVLVSVL